MLGATVELVTVFVFQAAWLVIIMQVIGFCNLVIGGTGGEFSHPERMMTTWIMIVPPNVDNQDLMRGSVLV